MSKSQFKVPPEQMARMVLARVEGMVELIIVATTDPGVLRREMIKKAMDEIEAMAKTEGGTGVAWVRATIAWAATKLDGMTTG